MRRAAERDSEDGAAEINLQILRLRREGRAPIDIYEVLTRQYADRPELWRKLATEYAAIGRVGEAIAACRQILVLDPRDQQALANLEKLLKSQPGN